MIDPTTAILAFLRAQTTVTTLTVSDAESGIYVAGELPPSVVDQSSAPRCVTVQEVPGSTSVSFPVIAAKFFLITHAPSQAEARTLFGTCQDGFHPGGIQHGPIIIENRWLMRSANLPTPRVYIEDDSGWPTAMGMLAASFNALEIS